MKRRTLWILLAGVVIGMTLSGLYKHFGTERAHGELEVLDGNGSYVDNDALWRVLAGEWSSGDARWTLTLDGDDHMALTFNGKTAAESTLSFAYLRPGDAEETELTIETPTLYAADGTESGEIMSLVHKAEEGSLTMELSHSDGTTETVTFQKIQK